MYCHFCGKENKDDQLFCKYCGKKLRSTIQNEGRGEYNSTESNIEFEPRRIAEQNYDVQHVEKSNDTLELETNIYSTIFFKVCLAIFVVAIIVVGIIIAVHFGRNDKNDSHPFVESGISEDLDQNTGNPGKTIDDNIIESDPIIDKENSRDEFRHYLDTVLVPEFGVFKSPQEGTLRGSEMGEYIENEWIDPYGILNASIYDFDMDGDEEMLVILNSDIKKFGSPADDDSSALCLGIYENDNGGIHLSDSIVFGVDEDNYGDTSEWNESRITISRDAWLEFCHEVSVANIDGQVYLLCESREWARTFGDGSNQNYWALTYQDNSIKYAYSFTQIRGGSSGFVFGGYEYSDGKCVSSEICYSEENEPEVDEAYRDKDFSESVYSFFQKHGLRLNKNLSPWLSEEMMKSIFSDDPNVSLLFELNNECNSMDDNDRKYDYKLINCLYGEASKEELKQEEASEGKNAGEDTDFEDFVLGKSRVRVADDCNNYNTSDYKSGKEYYLSELIDSVYGENKTVSYATLHIHDRSIYALEIGYVDYDVEYNTLFMLSNNNGDLEIIYVVNSGMRTWVSVNEKGIVNISGGEDYGTYFDTMYAPDQSLTYQQVYNCEQYIGEGYRDYDTTYDTTNMSALDRVIIESGKNDEKARDVTYYKEDIDGKTYYYYSEGAEKITQDTVDYIDSVAEGYGFRFDGKGAADTAREKYEKELGVFEACQDTKIIEFDVINNVSDVDAGNKNNETYPGIIFPNSSEEVINPDDIKKLSDEDLRYAINDLYAIKGYIFKDDDLRNHYSKYDWYKESIKPEDFKPNMKSIFNNIEYENLMALSKERDSR